MSKNPLKTYNFWFKIIGAALLIAFGLWIIFDEAMEQKGQLVIKNLIMNDYDKGYATLAEILDSMGYIIHADGILELEEK